MQKTYQANTWFFSLFYIIVGFVAVGYGVWSMGLIKAFLYAIGFIVFISSFSFFIINFYPEDLFSQIALDSITKIKSVFKGKFILKIGKEGLQTRYDYYPYTEIKSYISGKGGSESSLILHNGNRVDLETSWLKKEEQQEVETYLNQRINAQG